MKAARLSEILNLFKNYLAIRSIRVIRVVFFATLRCVQRLILSNFAGIPHGEYRVLPQLLSLSATLGDSGIVF